MHIKIISKPTIGMLLVLSLVNCLASASVLPKTSRSASPAGVPRIMFSTDVANGLISTHGAWAGWGVGFHDACGQNSGMQ